jgi:hypothetical protein
MSPIGPPRALFPLEEKEEPMNQDTVISKDEARDLIDAGFEQYALLLGGLAAVQEVDDSLVWRLVENLDVVRDRVLRRLEDLEVDGGDRSFPHCPHPAIQDFLYSIRRS